MKYILLTIVVIINNAPLLGQFSITSFNTTNADLPSNYLSCVEIDDEHILWFGGTDYAEGEGGVFRFDGDEWTFSQLEEDTSRPGINHIFEVLFGPHKDMWLFTYGQDCRITRVDSNGQEDFTPANIFGSSGLSHAQSIWYVDWYSGLYEYNYDSLKWIFHNDFPLDGYSPITALDVDSTGTFWVAVGNKNIYRFKDTILSKIELFPEYPPKFKTFFYINSTAFAKDGSVWFATSEGLVHWFGEDDFIIYDSDNSNLPFNNLDLVWIDQRGFVWTTMFQNGLAVLKEEGGDFVIFNQTNSAIDTNDIRDIAEDKDGNIWLATWGGGASKISYNTTGLHFSEELQSPLTIHPNPVNVDGEIIVYHHTQPLISLEIRTTNGTLAKRIKLETTNGIYPIKLTGLASGNYIVIAKDLSGNQFTGKFVVVH